MKVAFMTNNQKTIAKHIGLAKYIALYQLPQGDLLEVVKNPIMQKIEDDKITLSKDDEGERHLHVGHIIPQFLYEKGIDVFVSQTFGKGVKKNLLEMGITPIAIENTKIEEFLKMMQKNQGY